MRVIAVIKRPAVIRQILDDLGLPTTAASFRALPDQADGLATVASRDWIYEMLFDDLPSPEPVLI